MKWRLLHYHALQMVSSSMRQCRCRPLSSSSTTRSSDVPHHHQQHDNNDVAEDSHRHQQQQVFTYFLDHHNHQHHEEEKAGDKVNRTRRRRRSTLYIPLTSYCNSKSLPATRGPNFCLPATVVAALGRVRDVEQQRHEECQEEWRAAATASLPPDNNGRQKLPPPPPPMEKESNYYQSSSSSSLSLNLSNRRPTVNELMVEVDRVVMNYDDIAGIVIAGEGEPTLALDKLLDLLSRLRSRKFDDKILPIRINTNGIIQSIPAADRLLRHAVDLSVDLSVALMSHDAVSYQSIMDVDAHHIVVDFCRRAVQQFGGVGASVELTAVDRPGIVDRTATERLARDILGVHIDDDDDTTTTSVVRWRPYFP